MYEISEMELIQQRIKDYASFNVAVTYQIDSITEQALDLSEMELLVNKKLSVLDKLHKGSSVLDTLRNVRKINLLDLKKKLCLGC